MWTQMQMQKAAVDYAEWRLEMWTRKKTQKAADR
jgi:hypothetical protein